MTYRADATILIQHTIQTYLDGDVHFAAYMKKAKEELHPYDFRQVLLFLEVLPSDHDATHIAHLLAFVAETLMWRRAHDPEIEKTCPVAFSEHLRHSKEEGAELE